MFMVKTICNSAMAFAAIAVLTVSLSSIPARAQDGAAYALLISAGFLCDAADSGACPAVVKSEGGDTFEISGAGVFNPRQKTVTATGTFTHRSLDGNTRATGIWIASEFVSFQTYGVAPGALRREVQALGSQHFGGERMPLFSGSMPVGGLAVLRIRLLPVRGFAKNATLRVNCDLGTAPAEHPTEEISLAFERSGTEFNEEISGSALFLLAMPGAGAAIGVSSPAVKPEPRATQ